MKLEFKAWHLLPVTCMLIVWQLLGQFDFIDTMFYPTPLTIFIRLIDLFKTSEVFVLGMLHSARRFSVAATFAVPFSIALAIGTHLFSIVNAFVRPLIMLTYPLPKLAIYPFFLLVLGIGDGSKIFLIGTGIFYFVFLQTLHGIGKLETSNTFEMTTIYRIPFCKKVFHIMIKGALLEILEGIKQGLGHGLVMVMASELIAAQNGIGFFIWNAWDQFRIPDMYCGLLIFGIWGGAIFLVIDFIKSKLRKYYGIV